MKIIITDTFKISYIKFWGKNRPSLVLLCKRIAQDLLKQERYLQRPYLKIKCDIDKKAIRLVAQYFKEDQVLIPIFITDKNDTIYGENMLRETIEQKIIPLLDKVETDLLDGNISNFDI